MIYKIPTNQPGLVCVVFELPSCVWADRIVVSGTFNNWDERAFPCVRTAMACGGLAGASDRAAL